MLLLKVAGFSGGSDPSREPEACLKATTLNLRFQGAGLDGTGGAYIRARYNLTGLLYLKIQGIS